MTFVLIGINVGVALMIVLDAGFTKLAEWEIKKFHSTSNKRRRTGFFAVLEA